MNIKQIIFSGPTWLRYVAKFTALTPVPFQKSQGARLDEKSPEGPGVSAERQKSTLLKESSNEGGKGNPSYAEVSLSEGCRNSMHTVTRNMFRMNKPSGTTPSHVENGSPNFSNLNPFSQKKGAQPNKVSGVRVVRNDLSEEDLEVVRSGENFFKSGLLSWGSGKGKKNPFSGNIRL